ncbi:MAG: prolyl oligopeptidase family serine peptidase [Pirellulaceae bacterium]|nr:prolyl oligopeptidase family serine peptidase [Pirellulaceae bacterium]
MKKRLDRSSVASCRIILAVLTAVLTCGAQYTLWGDEQKSSLKVADKGDTLLNTRSLANAGDLSEQMVAGIHRFLDREIAASIALRETLWSRDFSDPAAYERSIEPNRQRFKEILGVVDSRIAGGFENTSLQNSHHDAMGKGSYTIQNVRWPVFDGVYGEGLLLEPRDKIIANVVALPDATLTPEDISGLGMGLDSKYHLARRLAENGCRVVVPVLLSRDSSFSGSTEQNRWTNLSHREWIWRMAFEVGRTPVGFEIQKVLAAVDCFKTLAQKPGAEVNQRLPIGVAGYGDGGRIALYAAALDSRIQAVMSSGYFDARQRTWTEPVDRTIWSLLKEFGDAEVATLIAPRTLIVEFNPGPIVDAVQLPKPNQRSIAAPGKLVGIDFHSAKTEVDRARALLKDYQSCLHLVHGDSEGALLPGSDPSLHIFLNALGYANNELKESKPTPNLSTAFDITQRQRRTVKELETFTQGLVAQSERIRADQFWSKINDTNAEEWKKSQRKFRKEFDEQVIGKWEEPRLPLNPQSHPAVDSLGKSITSSESKFKAWDVTLDVFPDVFAWGILLIPNDLKANERRPVVVCQHGLEGLPEHCITTDSSTRAWKTYKGYAGQLVELGFVVFVPHNPYRGGDEFRLIQRKSWLLGRHLFSVINAQHECILDWLSTLEFVDANRIAFYGLSYGGKSAMRIPAIHDRYCLSICSGDFNEWVRKNAAIDYPSSYLYTPEYEIFEWNLGHTYNYAEMAALIAPRPFMVEHGFQDRVATPEWASYEYAKVRRFYSQLGIADRTQYEFFDGPHTIHGQGTFRFLQEHLR